jgi:putative hydrolase of the HAD superfamily
MKYLHKMYKNLFFDIDRTIWDYDANLIEILDDIFEKYSLQSKGVSKQDFYYTFNKHNEELWKLYRSGKMQREELRIKRFMDTFKEFGIHDNELAAAVAIDYLAITPTKTKIFPDTIETLTYLKLRYQLHIITNGFNEVQFKKLINSGIDCFFHTVITSDIAGHRKPDKRIFAHALSSVNAKKTESLMIGDDWEADILGAKSFGIDQVFFNPKHIQVIGKATFEIFQLSDLIKLL